MGIGNDQHNNKLFPDLLSPMGRKKRKAEVTPPGLESFAQLAKQ